MIARNTASATQLHEPQPQARPELSLKQRQELLAWVYLRQTVEASNSDILELLWPEGWEERLDYREGNGGAVPDVRALATRIRHRDPTLPKRILESTAARVDCDPEAELAAASRAGYRLITPLDQEWPESIDHAFAHIDEKGCDEHSAVRGLAAAPFALWLRGGGNLRQLTQRAITIVGTREPNAYGVEMSNNLASDMAQAGYCVVSGGARGVDQCAHHSALNAGSTSIAVLACGLNVDYPRENRALFSKIAHRGVIVSEYALGTRPARHRFLTRNRIAAALSPGTIVTQAANRSGALNTLNWAEVMLKQTMVVPGAANNAHSQGCLHRLKDHRASAVWQAQHVRELIEPATNLVEPEQFMLNFDGNPENAALSHTQVMVYDATGSQDQSSGTLAAIQQETGLGMNLVMRTLKELENKGVLSREQDRWVRVDSE